MSQKEWTRRFDGVGKQAILERNLGDEEEARDFGHQLAQWAQRGETIGFVGPLGAGKTTIIKGIVEALSQKGQWRATSPTYALVQVYETSPPVYHMDLYRLESFGDLESIGYWDYVESRRGISCVEWIDKIDGAWPGQGAVVRVQRRGGDHWVELWGDRRWRKRVTADKS